MADFADINPVQWNDEDPITTEALNNMVMNINLLAEQRVKGITTSPSSQVQNLTIASGISSPVTMLKNKGEISVKVNMGSVGFTSNPIVVATIRGKNTNISVACQVDSPSQFTLFFGRKETKSKSTAITVNWIAIGY